MLLPKNKNDTENIFIRIIAFTQNILQDSLTFKDLKKKDIIQVKGRFLIGEIHDNGNGKLLGKKIISSILLKTQK